MKKMLYSTVAVDIRETGQTSSYVESKRTRHGTLREMKEADDTRRERGLHAAEQP